MSGHTMYTDGSCYSHSSRAVLLADGNIAKKDNGEPLLFQDEQQALRAVRGHSGEDTEIAESEEGSQ